MKGLKKTLTVFAVMLVSLGILAGCKKKGVTGNVVIEFWEQDGADQQAVLDELIAGFQKEYPNITVKRVHHETEDLRKNFTSAAIGGQGPDVVLGPNDNLGVFVPGDLIVPASDVMGDAFLGEFDPVALDAAKYNGKQYMIPDRNGNELCLIYNKKLTTKVPQTWEEMVKIANELKAQGKVQYVVTFNLVEPFFTVPFLGAFGGKVFDDATSAKAKPTLNTPEVKAWFEWLAKIHKEGQIPKEMDYDVASNLFKEGKTAYLINGPWSFVDYLENASMDIGIAPIPQVNGKWPAPYSAVKGYTISQTAVKDANKKGAVRLFVEWVTSKDAQLKMMDSHKQLPTIKSAMTDKSVTDDPMIAGQKAQLEKATPMPIITQMRAVWDAVKPVQQELFAGKIKPEDAPAKMQKRAEDGIKALGL